MNEPTTIPDVRTALGSIVSTFEPKRVRFRHLEPFKEEIRDLRSRGAAFVTIAEILKRHSIKASREAVRQFYRATLESKRGRRKGSRNRRPEAKGLPERPTIVQRKTAPVVPAPASGRGPRIARVEEL